MDKQQIEEKFEKKEFKDLLKKHRNSTIWDIVLFGIALLCMIIISFAPVVKVSGEKLYINYMQALRTGIENSDGKPIKSDNEKLEEGRYNAMILAVEKSYDSDESELVKAATDLKVKLSAAYMFLVSGDDATIEESAKGYSKLNKSYGMADYMKIILGETQFKSDGVGVFSVDLFGAFYWMLNSIIFYTVLAFEAVFLLLSILKLCFNKRYTQYMYNKRYTNYSTKKGKIRGGMQSLSFVFFLVFIIFYLCSSSKTKYFKEPARIFLSAVSISPLIYVMAGISLVVLVLSAINIVRKKKLHEWMCIHA